MDKPSSSVTVRDNSTLSEAPCFFIELSSGGMLDSIQVRYRFISYKYMLDGAIGDSLDFSIPAKKVSKT